MARFVRAGMIAFAVIPSGRRDFLQLSMLMMSMCIMLVRLADRMRDLDSLGLLRGDRFSRTVHRDHAGRTRECDA